MEAETFMRFYLLLALLLLLCCAKKEEPLQLVYTPPKVEWADDLDFEELPEANDTAGNLDEDEDLFIEEND